MYVCVRVCAKKCMCKYICVYMYGKLWKYQNIMFVNISNFRLDRSSNGSPDAKSGLLYPKLPYISYVLLCQTFKESHLSYETY